MNKESVTNNKYIVKNLAPWMLDELLAFSEFAKFDLILLREQKDFYLPGLEKLKQKGINVYIKPFKNKFNYYKFKMVVNYVFRNLLNFFPGFNFAIGVKGIIWFLRLDSDLFDGNSKIHAQFATQATIVAQLIKEFYTGKPEYSFTFHAHDIYFENKWFKRMVLNSRNAFSISEYNINYVKGHFDISDKVKLSRLGVFCNLIDKKEKKKVREGFRMGLISWFMPKKGIIYLLQAIKQLRDEGFENFKLILAGDGPLKDEIKEFIKIHNLEEVNYVGQLDNKQKIEFFKDLDVFVLPSISLENDQDGIPVVLMEAIAYELPIISTNISGIPEICINEYNGFLIEEKNSRQIVDKIRLLRDDDLRRDKFSKRSLRLSEEYDIRINSLKKIQLLNW